MKAAHTSATEPHLTLSAISNRSRLWLGTALIVVLFLIWQAVLPLLAELHFRVGFNLKAGGRYKYAAEELLTAISYAPWETYYQTQLGHVLENHADRSSKDSQKLVLLLAAEKLYKQMISLDSQNPWFQNRLSAVYLQLSGLKPKEKQSLLDLAEQYGRQASQADQNNPLFQLSYAFFLHQNGKLELAKTYYQKVIDIDETILEAPFNLADVYRRLGDTEKTIPLYLSVHRQNPDFQRIRFILSRAYLDQGDFESAETYILEALEATPSGFDALRGGAAFYHEQQKWTKAIPIYEEFLRLFPSQTGVVRFYIEAVYKSGQTQQAYRIAKSHFQTYPEDQEAKTYLRNIGMRL